ncbi:CRISPR-associated protein Cas4 [Domibacillus antri]|uniref:CRISPR-associated exonuclease Cas4 n=1 Tax=Domibacillus antri TaxID=1714264 RepID=A0A1Q8Q522_9BACI|nr:CRISPR-associated protein Cas4 [Domibacillus antri]OLN22428.1 CRISPR-associated protein Cas4 [Domibacillus antri]
MDYKQEDHYLMLSGIQHFQFCPRQWALIHIEQEWKENAKTVEGQHLHRKADNPFQREKRGPKLIVRAMPVKSDRLNISGQCDVVEFWKDQAGVPIHGTEGMYQPYPVEYKRGKPKKDWSDELQLTAQAMCLEEMLLCSVHTGYMFYNETKHRIDVEITRELRDTVERVVSEMNDYYKRRHTPKAKTGPHCKSCSLKDICLPEMLTKRSVKSYIEGRLFE